jgi:hypothetical protein
MRPVCLGHEKLWFFEVVLGFKEYQAALLKFPGIIMDRKALEASL